MDPLSIITVISAGLKMIDQFRELALRLRGQAPTPPKGTAEQKGTALEVKYEDRVVHKVDASDLNLGEWDRVRYDALRQRLRTNWNIYNDLFASEAGAEAGEGARIRADLHRVEETLCNDFREMVRLYERALGTSLPDHYQLREVCGPTA
ncbi:MAG TPA: hypothetical protein VF771_16615 [Longimicrobiaceae bacterium]